MFVLKLTCALTSAGLVGALALACSRVEVPAAPAPAPTPREVPDAQAKRMREEPDSPPDAADDEEEEQDEEEQDDERSAPPDAGKNKADAGDAGKKASRKPHADAGDAGGDAGAVDCSEDEQNNSELDLFECDQFESDDCESYAGATCQDMHFMMDHKVFDAFVECLLETPGLDLCDEDQSTAKECEHEAKRKSNVCLTHQAGCEAYQGCDTMSVDECDEAVAIYNTRAIDLVSEVFECDVDPTYFFGD